MGADPTRVADTRAWLHKASTDLRLSRHVLAADPPFLGDAVFHAHQAAEKTMKAFLTWHDVPFRRTHSLEELGEQCSELDGTLRTDIDAVVPLPSLEEARHSGEAAERLFGSILRRLPAEARI